MNKELQELRKRVDFLLSVVQVTVQVGSPLDPKPQTVRLSAKELYKELAYNGAKIVASNVGDAGDPALNPAADGADSSVGSDLAGADVLDAIDGQVVSEPEAGSPGGYGAGV